MAAYNETYPLKVINYRIRQSDYTPDGITWSVGGPVHRVMSAPTYYVGKTGVRTKDWAVLLQNGVVVCTPYSRKELSGKLHWSVYDQVSGLPSVTSGYRGSTDYWFTPGFPPAPSDDSLTRANLNYFEELRGCLTAWESLVTVAEAGSSYRLLASAVTGLKRHTVNFLRTSNRLLSRAERSRRRLSRQRSRLTIRRFRRDRARVSDAFLAYQLGVKPLVMDVQTAMHAITSDFVPVRAVKGSFSRAVPIQRTVALSTQTCSYASWSDFSYEGELSWKYTVTGLFKIDATTHRFGVDKLGVISAAWEIVPLSFVIDYFMAIDAYLVAKQLYSFRPEKLCVTLVQHLRTWPVNPDVKLSSGVPASAKLTVATARCDGRSTALTVTRSVSNNNLVPQMASCRPLGELSLFQGANMLALARALSRRTSRYKALLAS